LATTRMPKVTSTRASRRTRDRPPPRPISASPRRSIS
jgi:hypothetical protein